MDNGAIQVNVNTTNEFFAHLSDFWSLGSYVGTLHWQSFASSGSVIYYKDVGDIDFTILVTVSSVSAWSQFVDKGETGASGPAGETGPPELNASFAIYGASSGGTIYFELDKNGKTILAADDTGTPGAYNINIHANADVNYPIGYEVEVIRTGEVSDITINPEVGVTLFSADSNRTLRTQYSSAVLTQIDTDQWVLRGDLITL